MTPFVYIVPLKTLKVNVKSVKINNKLESNMLNKNRKVAFHTLGCKVNSYETEAMRNQLEQNGYEIADFKPGADIYIINTCTVTNIADRKSRQMLHKAKKMNKDAVVIAVGCYVQAAGEELLKDEAIDIVVGSNRKSEIVHIIEEYYAGKDHSYLSDISKSCEYDDMEMSSLAERTRLIRTGVIVLGLLIVYLSVVFLGYLSVAYYGLISVFLLVWLIYYVFYMTSVEYEYALVKNELSIDIIYGKNKRKNEQNIDVSKCELIAPVNSSEAQAYRNATQMKTFDYTSGENTEQVYLLITPYGASVARVYLEFDEKLLAAVKIAAPGKVKS